MIQGLFAFLPFLKEILFGRTAQDNNKKPMGRWSKLLVYGVVVGSLSMNYFLFKKTYSLSLAVIELRKQVGDVQLLKDQLEASDAQNKKLTEILGDIVTGKSSNIKKLKP